MTPQAAPVGGILWNRAYQWLAGLTGLGVILMLFRYAFGLGAATGLSDGYPFGIWIAFDVVTGTALGCGGYAVAILVYVLNKRQYHPLVRPAVLTAVLGYSLAGFSIFLDVGRYWEIWKIPLYFWHWNLHSALLEVALCIMAYTGVLWIEMAPPILEGWREAKTPLLRRISERALPVVGKLMIPLLAVGMLLPTMHQSSLGTVMMLAGGKVHPLWQSPLLPLLFLLSVIGMGYAAVVFETTLSSWLLDRRFDTAMLGRLGVAMSWLTAAFLAVRFADLALRGKLRIAFTGGWMAVWFWLEIALFAAAAVMARNRAMRSDPGGLFQTAMTMMTAGALYRFNVYIVAFNPGSSWSYFPAIPEVFITIGIVSAEIMAFIFFIRRFPILSSDGSNVATPGRNQS
jgi:Ni/Fe-hydrogenase subunit HybB-like protein